jgi:hypothetical protein
MLLPTSFRGSCKDSSAYNNGANGLGQIGSNPTKAIASTAATGLVFASCGFGAVFAWSTGVEHGWLMASLFVVFAVCLELSKPLAISAMFAAFSKWRVIRGVALALLASVGIAYSLTAEITLMSMVRGDMVAERMASTKAAKSVDNQRDRIEAELAKLANARPAATVKAEIGGILADQRLGDCRTLDGPRTKAACPRVSVLRAELGNADRREKLEADLAALPSNGPVLAIERPADPGAHAVGVYLAALGLATPTGLSEWMAAIGVIALEVGSALAGLLVGSVGPVSERKTTPLVEQSSERQVDVRSEGPQTAPSSEKPAQPSDQPDPNKPSKRTKKRKAKRTRRDAKRRLGNVVRLIEARGGKLTSTQQSMARQLRLSKTRVNELLRELEGAGRVKLRTSRAGTTVALVA